MDVTINKIAELAEVSRGTVDRVLHNRGNVRPEVAQKVRRIAEELGYRPNAVAKALVMRKRRYVIGVIVNSIGNHFFDDIIEGMEAAARDIADSGIVLSVKTSKGYSVEKQLLQLEELRGEGVNALALTPFNDERIVGRLREIAKSIPVVVFNNDIEGVDKLAYVGCDYYKSGRVAGELMGKIVKGPCRAAVITGSIKMSGHNDRIRGFADVLRREYPNITIGDIAENNDDEQASYEATKAILSAGGYSALYFTAGGVEGGIRALRDLGLERKTAVITYDATPAVRENLASGIISFTLCQQSYRQGYLPIRILADYLASGVAPEKQNHYMDIEVKVKNNL